ncbi:hypothetical protein AYI68_g7758 [Smittium mucronatum]|uniref:Uncharacterized protein n=1 Tax=Smittium mucronatum TaxID=133383 RepID=A0A1R0GMV3_9FUNG|nr:hypothetical protein AYI68_g7758 [Smittium mucronatum]
MKVIVLTSIYLFFGSLVLGIKSKAINDINDINAYDPKSLERIQKYYQVGFDDGYKKCEAHKKEKLFYSQPHITKDGAEFIKSKINSECFETECNLDFSLFGDSLDILVRIQCFDCPNLKANQNCMVKLTELMEEGENSIELNLFKCTSFGSWTFVPSNDEGEHKFLKESSDKRGIHLPNSNIKD